MWNTSKIITQNFSLHSPAVNPVNCRELIRYLECTYAALLRVSHATMSEQIACLVANNALLVNSCALILGNPQPQG